MSPPRNCTCLYVVCRQQLIDNSECVIEAFKTYQKAEEMCGVYQQKLIDKNITEGFKFIVRGVYYYDL